MSACDWCDTGLADSRTCPRGQAAHYAPDDLARRIDTAHTAGYDEGVNAGPSGAWTADHWTDRALTIAQQLAPVRYVNGAARPVGVLLLADAYVAGLVDGIAAQ